MLPLKWIQSDSQFKLALRHIQSYLRTFPFNKILHMNRDLVSNVTDVRTLLHITLRLPMNSDSFFTCILCFTSESFSYPTVLGLRSRTNLWYLTFWDPIKDLKSASCRKNHNVVIFRLFEFLSVYSVSKFWSIYFFFHIQPIFGNAMINVTDRFACMNVIWVQVIHIFQKRHESMLCTESISIHFLINNFVTSKMKFG